MKRIGDTRKRIRKDTETGKTERLMVLFIGVILIAAFMFLVGPWMRRLPLIHPLLEFIEERDINTAALYYTEIEEFSVAEFNIDHSMRFPPEPVKK